MKNKNLQSLLSTIADQQENGAELENLDQDLAAKLKGGVQESLLPGETTNNGCPITNYSCAAE
jgi:hypothetical protein